MAERKKQTKASETFTKEEREAMRETARERRRAGKSDGEQDVREKIAEMPQPDRGLAERIHALVRETAPDLAPRTWYGMPAYAKDGKVLCYFQAASKFKSRYGTFGFNDTASLDDGPMWPTSFALTELTPAVEKRIATLVKRAVKGLPGG
jgi:uncharacterized protein YdhG (YjbR/CyaY superfamily)